MPDYRTLAAGNKKRRLTIASRRLPIGLERSLAALFDPKPQAMVLFV